MKRVIAVILMITILLSLTACGNKEKTSAVDTEIQQSEETTEKKKDRYTLSEYLASGETIWYVTKGSVPDKDEMPFIYVMEPDGTAYHGGGLTFGELSKMNDTEIKAFVEEKFRIGIMQETSPYTYITRGEMPTVSIEDVRESQLFPFLSDQCFDHAGSQFSSREELEKAILSEHSWKDCCAVRSKLKYIDQSWDFYQRFIALVEKLKDPVYEPIDWYLIVLNYHKSDLILSPQIALDIIAEKTEEFGIEWTPGFQETFLELKDLMEEMRVMVEKYTLDYFELCKEFIDNPKPIEYALAATTDPSGNHVTSMEILAYKFIFSGLRFYQITNIRPLDAVQGVNGETHGISYPIYDSKYTGYKIKDDKLLLTRVNDDIQLELDDVGNPQITLDVNKSADDAIRNIFVKKGVISE